ncbi:MAG: hypothetical protein ABI598_02115, partial [Chloroflexota bacterium]
PILWNLDGAVVESFSPDFYLPELDLYLEMTTLKQRLVRKKNRKLRRLRELYPSIRIKLFYARDFRAMMLKYGRLALADSLSGTLGQIGGERIPIEPWAPEPTAVELPALEAAATLLSDAAIRSTDPEPAASPRIVGRQRRRGKRRPPTSEPDMLVIAGSGPAARRSDRITTDHDPIPPEEAPST